MNRIQVAPPIALALLALLVGCSDPAPADAFPQGVADSWIGSFNSGDVAGLALMYTADAEIMPPDEPVIAIGSHEPEVRELDAGLMGRSQVVVEDAGTAMREAGDVILAVREGALDPAALIDLPGLLHVAPDPARPRVFKGVGMAWQDLVVATEITARHQRMSAAE